MIDVCFFFFFNDTATTEIYTLSLHDALPISRARRCRRGGRRARTLLQPRVRPPARGSLPGRSGRRAPGAPHRQTLVGRAPGPPGRRQRGAGRGGVRETPLLRSLGHSQRNPTLLRTASPANEGSAAPGSYSPTGAPVGG